MCTLQIGMRVQATINPTNGCANAMSKQPGTSTNEVKHIANHFWQCLSSAKILLLLHVSVFRGWTLSTILGATEFTNYSFFVHFFCSEVWKMMLCNLVNGIGVVGAEHRERIDTKCVFFYARVEVADIECMSNV